MPALRNGRVVWNTLRKRADLSHSIWQVNRGLQSPLIAERRGSMRWRSNKEEVLGMRPVTRFELAPRGRLDVCPFETEGLIRNFELSATNNCRNRENAITKV